MRPFDSTILSLLCLALLFPSSTLEARSRAPAPTLTLEKEDKSYVAIAANYNKFKSIELVLEDLGGNVRFVEFPVTAQVYGSSITLGTYISNNFKTEIRYGTGLKGDNIGAGAMDINISEWFNWYIGGAYPVTDYATAYVQYGLSFYSADVTRYVTRRFVQGDSTTPDSSIFVIPSSTEMEPELFGEKFSTSWMAGVDFQILKDTFFSFEYGRLLNDSDTGIKVYQVNTALKYEF